MIMSIIYTHQLLTLLPYSIIPINHSTSFNTSSFVTHTFAVLLSPYLLSKLLLTEKYECRDNVMKIIPHTNHLRILFLINLHCDSYFQFF